MKAVRFASREALLAELRAHVSRDWFPRLTVTLILALCAASAFLASFGMLGAGMDSMAARYGAAALVGYLMFLLLIRGWIRVHRPAPVREDRSSVLDAADVPLDLDLPRGGGSPRVSPDLFARGRSGGGGGGAAWDTQPLALADGGRVRGGASGGGWWPEFDLDLDELWWLVLAAVLAFGALVAVLFVVYSAPVLLAEVALDAAIVTPVYRRLRRQDARYWAGTVLRRTWIPALVVIVFAAGCGYALQQAAPEARSIGGVWRALTS
jgi:hypothetical protein